MGILDNAKEVAKAVHEINNLDLYQRVLALNFDIISLVEDNQKLREETRRLNAALELRGKMSFREPFYYQEGDATPFCPSCWEVKNQAVHVTYYGDGDTQTRWDCPACKTMYLAQKSRAHRPTPAGSYPGGGDGSWMG